MADDVAYPALDPPPILPWNDFDIDAENDRSLAMKLIAEIVMDDEWHDKHDVIEEVMYELELPAKSINNLLHYLRVHGDLRADEEWIRITTRWRGYTSTAAVV